IVPTELLNDLVSSLIDCANHYTGRDALDFRDIGIDCFRIVQLLLTAPSPHYQQRVLYQLFEMYNAFPDSGEALVANTVLIPLASYVSSLIPLEKGLPTASNLIDHLVNIPAQKLWEVLGRGAKSELPPGGSGISGHRLTIRSAMRGFKIHDSEPEN